MGRRTKISREEFLKQFEYVNTVVCSCNGKMQYINAKRWAHEWSKNAINMTDEYKDAPSLFMSVIKKKRKNNIVHSN
mgnify:CR=1 FL=1